MRDFPYAMKVVCDRNREGSYATNAARQKVLIQVANQLESLGYKHLKRAEQLKPKHIDRLVSHWQEKGISAATMKNRMAHLRWLSRTINQRELLAKSNDHYGISERQYVSNDNRSTRFDDSKIALIRNDYVKAAALLQREFGLRREEAMKFIPSQADCQSYIKLQGSWTKGGKPREVSIRTESQREALAFAHRIAAQKSLIPPSLKYVQQMRIFEKEMHRVGLGRTHGARHLYAITRYKELTGRDAPVAGGLNRKDLSLRQRAEDEHARLTISRELGHERIQIVAVYIGS